MERFVADTPSAGLTPSGAGPAPDCAQDGHEITVSVIVVSYNTRELTLWCLESIFRETRRLRFEVLLVDNASADGSAEAVRRAFPQIRLHALTRNLGFAAANNLAAELARGRYLLLLNPDTIVLDRALERLVEQAERGSCPRILGGRTLFPDGSLNPSSCWARPTLWSVLCHALCLSSLFPRSGLFNSSAMGNWSRDFEREVDIVTGCFLLIPSDLWRSLGGFDVGYFMYGEEADLCLRAARIGPRPLFTPTATIMHIGGGSEPSKEDKLVRLLRSQRKLIRTHWPVLPARIGATLISLSVWMRAALGSLSAAAGRQSWERRGRGWKGAWRRRKEWQ